jgi:hypothetical protein
MSASPEAAPTNNPAAAYCDGPEGYPAWTDAIRWSDVIDMSRYASGRTNFEKFENARDELAAKGGGVLYYPAGVYDFSEGPFDGPQGRGLMLKGGVVIRGAAPAGKPNAARDGKLELGTKFAFGFQKKGGGQVPRDWNLIGLCPQTGKRGDDAGHGVRFVDSVGVCWVHLVGAVIYFGTDFDWGPTWATAGGWRSPFVKKTWADRKPDGAHPADPFMGGPVKPRPNWLRDPDGSHYDPNLARASTRPATGPSRGFRGAGAGRLVFGCVLEDSCLLNDFDTCGRPGSPEGFGADGFHMARYAARIAVYGSRVFVANNLLPASDKRCFGYEQATVKTGVPSDTRGRGYRYVERRRSTVLFDYNRVTGVDVNKSLLACVPGELADSPGPHGYFAEGVVVRDNFVFNHGLKGFDLSGQWVTVRGNRNERTFLLGGAERSGVKDWRLTLDGYVEAAGGGDGNISDNYCRALDVCGRCLWIEGNTYGNLGSSPGNDGEAICCQLHNGTAWHSWAVTHNRMDEQKPKGGAIYAYGIDTLGALMAWNKAPDLGYMGSRDTRRADIAFVANESKQLRVCPEAVTQPAAGRPAPPTDVQAAIIPAGDAVRVTWKDAASDEIGFRVERRIGEGAWHTIAYRPPRIEGAKENPQEWVDFLAPAGKPLTYRVLAVNARDEGGASFVVGPVTILSGVRR